MWQRFKDWWKKPAFTSEVSNLELFLFFLFVQGLDRL